MCILPGQGTANTNFSNAETAVLNPTRIALNYLQHIYLIFDEDSFPTEVFPTSISVFFIYLTLDDVWFLVPQFARTTVLPLIKVIPSLLLNDPITSSNSSTD